MSTIPVEGSHLSWPVIPPSGTLSHMTCTRLSEVRDACQQVRRAADLAWIVRTCPSCSGTWFVGRPRGLRLGFGEVCGPTGQQIPHDQHDDDHGHHAGLRRHVRPLSSERRTRGRERRAMAGSSSVRAGFAQGRALYPGTFGAIRIRHLPRFSPRYSPAIEPGACSSPSRMSSR
jgi:hypothetical protein